MPIGNVIGAGGGVTQSQLDAITRDNEVIIKSEADLLANSTNIGGVQVLNSTTYYFDGATVEIGVPIAPPDIGGAGNGASIIKGNSIVKYTGTGAFIRNNPNGTTPNGIGFFDTYLQGDGANKLFNLTDILQGVAVVNTTLENFNGSTLRSNTIVLFSQVRLLNFTDTFEFVDNAQVRISSSIDTSNALLGKPYYIISGTTPIINIGGDPQVIFQNPNDTFLKIDPFLNFKVINVDGVGLDNAAGGAGTGRLFTSGLSGSGTASDNGSGNVRINSVGHGLSDLDSIWVQGFNPYRTKGYKIELIGVDDFDLLCDYGDILSFADAGGGLIDVTSDLKHRMVNGQSVVITSTTYNGTYTVSGVSPLTPKLFQITEVFAGTDTGTYKCYEPFTTAGDNLNWYSGSLNESTPGVTSINNGKETDSTSFVAIEITGVGTTAIDDTSWTPLVVTATLQPDGEQRFEVADDGRLYYIGKKSINVLVNTSVFGQINSGTETEIWFSYLVNAETSPRGSTAIDKSSFVNKNRGKNAVATVNLNEGDYINPVAVRLASGTANFTLQTSQTFVFK
jgi:hypothetical protein